MNARPEWHVEDLPVDPDAPPLWVWEGVAESCCPAAMHEYGGQRHLTYGEREIAKLIPAEDIRPRHIFTRMWPGNLGRYTDSGLRKMFAAGCPIEVCGLTDIERLGKVCGFHVSASGSHER